MNEMYKSIPSRSNFSQRFRDGEQVLAGFPQDSRIGEYKREDGR